MHDCANNDSNETKNQITKSGCGYSLLELMLAMALSTVVVSLLLSVYLVTQNFNRTENEVAHFQEDLRMVSYMLTRNIEMAGYAGCVGIKDLQLKNHTSFNFSADQIIRGFDSQNMPSYLKGKVLAGTDVIVVQRAGDDATILTKPVVLNADSISVKDNPATQDNKVLLISDCVNGDLFTAKNEIGKRIYLASSKIENAYENRALVTAVSRFSQLAYFVGPTGDYDVKGNPIYSLYFLLNESGDKQELMTGISGMDIQYGVDVTGSGKVSAYYTAKQMQASQWEKVIAVLITLTYETKKWKIYARLRER